MKTTAVPPHASAAGVSPNTETVDPRDSTFSCHPLFIMESGDSLDKVEEHISIDGEKSWVHVVKTPTYDGLRAVRVFREFFGM